MTTMNILKLVASILICQAAGFVGSFFTSPAIPGWYAGIDKPSFTPPNWVFAPVWTALYVLMGVALFLVWRKGMDAPGVKVAVVVFVIQLILNAVWTPAFFGLRSPLAGLFIIAFMWVAILLTIIKFFPISRPAALLLIPYIAWVSFATVLNAYLYALNR